MEYLNELVSTYNPKILAFTESHLNDSVLDGEIKIKNYNSHRCDRKDRSHGGAISFIQNSVVCEDILSFSDEYCNLQIIKLPQNNLILINIYRPPDCPEQSFEKVVSKVRSTYYMLESPTPDVIMLGDFNFPKISWPLGTIGKGSTISEQNQSKLLLSLTDDLFMTQYILEPTRHNNILDLVFTNNDNLVYNYNIVPTVYSDHNIINLSLNYKKLTTAAVNLNTGTVPSLSLLNFHSVDWTLVNSQLLTIDWDSIFGECSLDEKVEKLNAKLNEICSQNIPLKRVCNKNPSIIPRDRKILMRKRNKLCKMLKETKTPEQEKSIFLKIHQIEKELHDSYENSRKTNESKAIENIKSNPKYFYSYAKQFSTTKVEVGPLIDDSSNIVNSNFEMAKLLMKQYEKAFSTPDKNKIVQDPISFFNCLDYSKPTFTDFVFSPQDISQAIDELKLSSAPGPDSVPTSLLKYCKTSLSTPLYKIWQQSLDTGDITQSFKDAHITPIHKGGSRAYPQNYRPISLTSHLIKVFERVIRKKIVTFLEDNSLMNPTQHGFRSGRSCLSQLLEHFDKIIECLEEGVNVDVIYLDFAKAFDKVDHGILCHKLRDLGIGGKIGVWLFNFLKSRMQRVVLNGTLSDDSLVKSGVPQGTVLGPVLFLIHISDINQGIQSHVASFADDTRITKSIRNLNDVDILQNDLENIYKWQKENNMLFNDKKFEILRYGKNLTIKEDTYYKTPNDLIITSKDKVKDLGIIMNNSATFNDHIDTKILKCKHLISWILRTFSARDELTMMTLWKSLVQPHLDYCSQLWAPTKLGDLNKLDSLLRNYTNKINGMKNKDYWQRLKILHIYSQGRRQERYIIIYAWKILENLVPNPGLKPTQCPRKGRQLKVPNIVKKSPCYVKTLKESSFSVRAPKLFNVLPKEIRGTRGCSVEIFKRRLDKFLSEIRDEPRISGYSSFCRGPSNSLLHVNELKVDNHVDRI